MRSGQGLVDLKDKRLLEVIEASLEIAKPLLSMMPSAKQAQPDQLLPILREMIDSGDWSKRGRILSWLNVFLGTTAFQSDRARLTPDVMALLNTSFLERWRSQLSASQQLPTATARRYEFVTVDLLVVSLPTRTSLRWWRGTTTEWISASMVYWFKATS